MKAFQQKGQSLFEAQTAHCASSLDHVKELSFANCSLAPELIQSKFSQLKNLTRLTMVDMKPPLNDSSLDLILSTLFNASSPLRSLDLCDNKITSLLISTPSAESTTTRKFPSLVRLILANNKIDSLDKIGLSAENFPALRTLDVADNCDGALDGADVRKDAFSRCPTLVVVNGKNKEGEDFYDASDNDDDNDFGGLDGEGLGDDEAFLDDDDDEEEEDDEDESGDDNYDKAKEVEKLSPSRRQRGE